MKALTLSLAAAVLAAAVVLGGCTAPVPPAGPAEPSLTPTPPSTGKTGGQIPHGGSRVPDAATRDSILAALRADGIEVSGETTLTMTYSADRQTVHVEGPMSVPATATGAPSPGAPIPSLNVEQRNGKWVVVK